MNLDQTISDLSNLSIDDRLRVVQRLWDSIPRDAEIAVTPEQRSELQRRLASHDGNPNSAISLDELERRLQGER